MEFPMDQHPNKHNQLSHTEILEILLDTTDEMVVIIDQNGCVVMLSRSYRDFLQVNDFIGKHVTEVIENTRLHHILETKISEIGTIQEINGNNMVASRIPIIDKNKQLLGAVGKVIFKDAKELYSLAQKVSRLESEIDYYKNVLGQEIGSNVYFNQISGSSPSSQNVKQMAIHASRTDSNVLIVGESGTGKELYAHAIHNSSKRSGKPFIRVNCAAIPSELLESELFGYDDGAFSGARKEGKKGKFELADGGSLLLDEIGEMPLNMQAKLLRVLQEKELNRLGGEKTIKIDVRIITSTNINLKEAMDEKAFREDLFYRLDVVKISLPPLRDRICEVRTIANDLLMKISTKMGIYVERIDNEVFDIFIRYNWPGNVRELENIVERAINLLDHDTVIQTKHLPQRLIENTDTNIFFDQNKTLPAIIKEIEKKAIELKLKETNFNKNLTSKLLGISRANLYKKIKEYHL
jgi:transcriptional regulator with PAS, ATPase and Fis domain